MTLYLAPPILRHGARVYRLPKHGSSEAEYEDAAARSPGRTYPRRFAVADGASESSFARLWADLLVEAYVAGGLRAGTLCDDLIPLQAVWQAEVERKPLPWYATEKARSGAFAALAGLTVRADGTWQALAVGDCCVMHVRDDRLLTSFPLAEAAAFDNRPRLLSSNPERNGHLSHLEAVACGAWEPGDGFLLLSDALAAYVVRSALDEGRGIGETLGFMGQQGFRRWVAARRAARALRNDDVTLIRVAVP
jgi:hypothetical protein